uniref:BAR domain-containing protein n=1 Tax=Noctiluca scintillans TaxID=2966 RepID=A0A7S1AN66_NOCSC|mmetsp:Transcript_53030/g.141767  ORF Transcript_53030/g.141767 Transcript_53030/m.141767 type:complete len:405 (+) Transcript_53030:23-1237(+)
MDQTLASFAAKASETRAKVLAASHGFLTGAERRLGIEVSCHDPAWSELFKVVAHLEELMAEVRAEGETLLWVAECLAEGQSLSDLSGASNAPGCAAPTISKHLDVSPSGLSGEGTVQTLLAEAFWHTFSLSPNANGGVGSARYLLERRLRDELFGPVQEQMDKHAALRQQVRDRHNIQLELDRSRNEVALLLHSKKSETDRFGVEYVSDQALKAQEQLDIWHEAMSNIDAQIFGSLLEVKREAWRVYAKMYGALSRLRAEFFCCCAKEWAPPATALGAGHRSPSSSTLGAGERACFSSNSELASNVTPPPPPPGAPPVERASPSNVHESPVTLTRVDANTHDQGSDGCDSLIGVEPRVTSVAECGAEGHAEDSPESMASSTWDDRQLATPSENGAPAPTFLGSE